MAQVAPLCGVSYIKSLKNEFSTIGSPTWVSCNGLFTMLDSDTDTDLDSDSKPNGYIVLCRKFHIAHTWTWIPTLCSCVGQESESEFVPESVSGCVNEP